jgi:2-polyprenyl-3-methyl-5-hydroxy-6-metoxy-1,4-benzoquinol methylase
MRDHNKEYQDASIKEKYVHNFDNTMRKYMMRSFTPFINGASALEIGCYKGEFTEILANRFSDLTVVEAASDLMEATQVRLAGRAEFFHSTIETFTTPKRFDAIFLMHTLEHLDEPVEALRKIGALLTPTGRLFLAVPNANAPSRQIAVKMGLIKHNNAVTDGEAIHGHRKTYSFDTLEHEVREAGLISTFSGGVFFKPLANYQLDRALDAGIIDDAFMEGCYALGLQYPDMCASIYLVCEKASR